MSASIHSLVAAHLDISDEKAQKLLAAMLREVKKRAHTKGVRLPEFGTFRERNGRLVFEPSESLARSVNRRFEGLESEDLASAPQEQEEEKQNEGPSTITLGYQDSSNWSPLDSEDSAEDPGDSSGEDDSGPDTEEFQVPSADQAADTSELQAQDQSASQPAQQSAAGAGRNEPDGTSRRQSGSGRDEVSPSAPNDGAPRERARDEGRTADSSPSRSQSNTSAASESEQDNDDLYPLVEDEGSPSKTPNRSASSSDQSINEAERESLSDIWHSDTVGEMSSETSGTGDSAPDGDTSAATDPFATPSHESDTDRPSPEAASMDDREPISGDRPSPEPTTDSKTPKSKDEGSSGARVFVTLLVLILLGGAAWYILGQRGMVQPPRTTLSNVNAQIQPLVQQLPVVGTQEQTSDSGPQPQATSSAGSTNGAESSASSSTQSTDDPTSTQEDASSASASIDPDAGGFTIIVASRTSQGGAQSVRDTYRQRFSTADVPVDVIPSTVDNTTRYRIGVGQFSNRAEAQEVLKKFGSKLPDGAWILGL